MSLDLDLLHHAGAFTLEARFSIDGRVTSLFGPSGAGKSTLVNAIAGLLRPARGRIVVDGTVLLDTAQGIAVKPWRRRIGYVFQEGRLFPHMTVRQNLLYGRFFAPRRAAALELASVVDLLGLGPLLGRRPALLSGGEKQRVAIGRALLAAPRLLLMDEPLSSLDHARKQDILPYLERLRDELDIPMLYVSHAPDEVARLADTVVLLDRGQVQACGPVTEVFSRLALPVLLGDDVGVLLQGRVQERDTRWHLCRVQLDGPEGHSLWLRDSGLPLGRAVRVRVLAREVSLALQRPEGSSIQNLLPARVQALGPDHHPAQGLVQVALGAHTLLARLTQRAIEQLGLVPGREVWAQVKSAALMQ